MRHQEKLLARKLRSRGYSIKEIVKDLKVAKSSVSIWVRDIKLTQEQRQELSRKGFLKDVVERRRETRLTKENSRRQLVVDRAKSDVGAISKQGLFLIGVALYWAEGSKTRRGIVEFCNGDPKLISIMMRFFKEICHISPEKFRGHIHLHFHLSAKGAEHYWHKVSSIPLNHFFKTSQQHNKSRKNKKDSLPFGTFSIYICSTELFLKLKGWREELYNKIV